MINRDEAFKGSSPPVSAHVHKGVQGQSERKALGEIKPVNSDLGFPSSRTARSVALFPSSSAMFSCGGHGRAIRLAASSLRTSFLHGVQTYRMLLPTVLFLLL